MDEAMPDEIDEPKTRPTGVSVIAVLAIVFGLLAFCCSPLVIGSTFIAKDPLNLAIRNDTTLFYFNQFVYAFGWLMSIVLTLIGFGLWKLKESARKGAIAYVIFMTVYSIAVGVISAIVIVPRQVDITIAVQGAPAGARDAALWIAIGIQASISCVMILVNVLIAVYLTRPKVRAAFQKQ